MIKSCLILFFIILFPFQRNDAQNKIDFQSPANIKSFADYLFCQKDYLRAYDEYKAYLLKTQSDSVEFKSALALQRIGSFDEALQQFGHIPLHSGFYSDSRKEYCRTLFLKNDFPALQNIYSRTDSAESYYSFLSRLRRLSLFYSGDRLPGKEYFISPFPQKERSFIKKFYDWKINPPYKSPLLAGILSTVIPGLGKVYTENYTDAVFAALLTGLFGYIAYTDFKADHHVRGWIFTGVAGFFYTGNIYGSAASAQIYNAKIKFNFETELHDFLDAFHYLSGVYNFCK
jgi:hypothetical protein